MFCNIQSQWYTYAQVTEYARSANGSQALHIDQLRKLTGQSGNTADLGFRPDNQITVQETINISTIAKLVAQDKVF